MGDSRMQRAEPLSPLTEGTLIDPPTINAATSPPSTPLRATRRRRVFGSFAHAIEDTRVGADRNSIVLNPEASEFVPSNKMPSKRKASSSAKPGKPVPSSSRVAALTRSNAENPIIRAQDVFGSSGWIRYSNAGDAPDSDSSDDEDDPGLFDLEIADAAAGAQIPLINADPTQRERFTEAMMVMRAQLAERSEAAMQPAQWCAAILFSRDSSASCDDPFDELVRLRYLPLQPRPSAGRQHTITKETELTILPSHRDRINGSISGSSPCRAHWPRDRLPVEIFDLITLFLSRDDLKSMRLVSREFERKVSGNIFASSVVPFNTELYDMIEEDSKTAHRLPLPAVRVTQKGKARAIDQGGEMGEAVTRGLHWQNAKEDVEGKVYKGHGLRVFQGFGPYFRRFGMSFEVAEAQLARPPLKKELDHIASYHGSYEWPHEQYTRFAGLAGLERTADETLRMKAAFSNLENVQELGLSLDNGLGWLNGPDRSIYARVFQRAYPVFGPSRSMPDQQMQDAETFWQAIRECHASLGVQGNQHEVSLARGMLDKAPSELAGLQHTKFANTQAWSSITAGRTAPPMSAGATVDEGRYGVLYTTFRLPNENSTPPYDKSALVPAELRKEQKEWLMETEWAQRAFLECYMLAVADNPATFDKVKVLTIAKVSSGLLPILSRETFWDALPAVEDVTVHVKPDWRSVERDNAGFAETCARLPSEAVNTFYRCMLRDRLCLRSRVKKLNVGWAAGGEHAEGIFARNNHILPAPITQLEHSAATHCQSGLVFNFVEHLTLYNCWLTPVTLDGLIVTHADKALKTLTLDSVSLTAHPRFAAGAQAAMHNQVLQALAALPAVPGQPVVFPPWLQNMPGLPDGWQQMLQHNAQQHALQMGWPAPPPLNLQQPIHHHQQFPQHPVGQAPWLQQGNGVLAGNNIAQHPGFMTQHGAGSVNVVPPFGANIQAVQPAQQPLVGPAPNTQPNRGTHWTEGHREGSWPQMLNKLSPAATFNDFVPPPPPWEDPLPERAETNLRALIFNSCGYVKLTHNTTIDQLAMEAGSGHHLSPWFRTRQARLLPAMMTTNDRYIGRIVQHIPEREMDSLRFAWGFREGWLDQQKAEEVEYDGLLPGGTGRFSGAIVKE